jgi:hypothetical protein
LFGRRASLFIKRQIHKTSLTLVARGRLILIGSAVKKMAGYPGGGGPAENL